MAVFRVFQLPKNQHFDYKPRYWDQDKDELEKRISQIESVGEGDMEAMKERIAGRFRSKGYNKDIKYRSRQVRRSNMTLILIVVALIIMSYFALSTQMPKILQFLN